jgi:hypothetical protein
MQHTTPGPVKRRSSPKGPVVLSYIRQNALKTLRVQDTGTDAGHGLFTVRPITATESLAYYGGPVVPDEGVLDGERQYGMTTDDGIDKWCILGRETAQKAKEDPAYLAGAASLANHRCKAPNCEFIEVKLDDDEVLVFLRAREDIPPDTEITVSYSKEYMALIGEKCVCADCVPVSEPEGVPVAKRPPVPEPEDVPAAKRRKK